MKKLLIISPYFPPSNAADMQRVRMSLPYFAIFGWEATVVTVDPKHSEVAKDELLLETIPRNSKVLKIKALHKKWTQKFGLGSLALRSLYFYKKEVSKILKRERFDLIYFSTTQFPVTILGAYWKKRFGIPYIIDMQDPWHSEYYKNKPKSEQPPKYWFSYRLNKYLEPLAMRKVDGLISVSSAYLETLKLRYPQLSNKPKRIITFGAFEDDLAVAAGDNIPAYPMNRQNINLAYVGRGGKDMAKALRKMFGAFKRGLDTDFSLFHKFRFYFIGTSYAPAGKGVESIMPVADEFALADYVTEQTDRIPYYSGLKTLFEADGLVVPGSDDPAYTASKLYPYILSGKPIIGFFNSQSSAVEILEKSRAGVNVNHELDDESSFGVVISFLQGINRKQKNNEIDWTYFNRFTAREMTKQQCLLFDEVVKLQKK